MATGILKKQQLSNIVQLNMLLCALQLWLDYIMFLTDYQQPTSSSFNIMEAKWSSPMRICWEPYIVDTFVPYRVPDDADCRKTETFEELSDHFPVVADFTFP